MHKYCVYYGCHVRNKRQGKGVQPNISSKKGGNRNLFVRYNNANYALVYCILYTYIY